MDNGILAAHGKSDTLSIGPVMHATNLLVLVASHQIGVGQPDDAKAGSVIRQ